MNKYMSFFYIYLVQRKTVRQLFPSSPLLLFLPVKNWKTLKYNRTVCYPFSKSWRSGEKLLKNWGGSLKNW